MPLPANVNTGTVTGTFTNDDGSAASGRVVFTPDVDRLLDASADTIVLLYTHVVKLSVSGAFSQVLVATDDADLNPLNWTWTVREEITGKPNRHYSIAVPAGSTQDLADISPIPQNDGTPVSAGGTAGAPGAPGLFAGTYTDHGDTGSTETIDPVVNVHRVRLNAATVTFTFTAPTTPVASVELFLVQDATGSRLPVWPASVKWAAGVAPTLTTTAAAIDRLVFLTYDTGTTWFGDVIGYAYA